MRREGGRQPRVRERRWSETSAQRRSGGKSPRTCGAQRPTATCSSKLSAPLTVSRRRSCERAPLQRMGAVYPALAGLAQLAELDARLGRRRQRGVGDGVALQVGEPHGGGRATTRPPSAPAPQGGAARPPRPTPQTPARVSRRRRRRSGCGGRARALGARPRASARGSRRRCRNTPRRARGGGRAPRRRGSSGHHRRRLHHEAGRARRRPLQAERVDRRHPREPLAAPSTRPSQRVAGVDALARHEVAEGRVARELDAPARRRGRAPGRSPAPAPRRRATAIARAAARATRPRRAAPMGARADGHLAHAPAPGGAGAGADPVARGSCPPWTDTRASPTPRRAQRRLRAAEVDGGAAEREGEHPRASGAAVTRTSVPRRAW